MHQLRAAELRALLALAAAAAALYLLAAAWLELAGCARPAAAAPAGGEDLAAWQIGQLMDEARDITRQAAAPDSGDR